MISEIEVHVIARQMFEKHGLEAIAQAAQNAQACENKGDSSNFGAPVCSLARFNVGLWQILLQNSQNAVGLNFR